MKFSTNTRGIHKKELVVKELEQGVFDLESKIPYDISKEMTQQLLAIYGEGIEQGIAAVILSCSARHRKWVGVSVSTIVSSLVNFDGARMGLMPADKEKVNELAVKIGEKVLSAVMKGLNGKHKWLMKVGHSSLGQDDPVLKLVIKETSSPRKKAEATIQITSRLQCPACKGNLPPLMKTKFCSYCGSPVPIEIQFKQAMGHVSNETVLEQMGMVQPPNCSEEMHVNKARFAKKYVTYLERMSRAASKKGGITFSKLARIWQETMETSLPYRSLSNKKKKLTEAEAKDLVSKNIIKFCSDCGARLAGM